MNTPIHKVADILRSNALIWLVLLALPTTLWGQTFVSKVNARSALDTSAVITWTTAVPASSLVKYGTSQAYGLSSTHDGTMVLQHSATISGLTASTKYHFMVVSADSSGEQVASLDSTFTTTGSALPPPPPPPSPLPTSGSRGYVTTPTELQAIAAKAALGIQPYADAVSSIKNFANTGSSSVAASTPNPTYWPYGTISGSQSCTQTYQPAFIGNGNPLVEAKALVYWLTGDTRYADNAVLQISQLASTFYYNGDTYSGTNQCILNLSWYIPSWIIAADLLDGYPGWSASDKQNFQQWLAREVYKKVDWASDRRSNNWGSAGSLAAGMIADYLSGSGILLVDRNGTTVDAATAYLEAKQRQLDRMNGNTYMDNYGCPTADLGEGFRPGGGIPWELGRGSTGCEGLWITTEDKSWTYTFTHLGPAMSHAEFLLRRGDTAIYDNITSSGAGSLLRAIYFVIHNPNNTAASLPWKWNRRQGLEMVYRYYASQGHLDPYIGQQLGIGTSSRYIGGENNPNPHFGTLTHGFAVGENPTLPPTVPPIP